MRWHTLPYLINARRHDGASRGKPNTDQFNIADICLEQTLNNGQSRKQPFSTSFAQVLEESLLRALPWGSFTGSKAIAELQ